MNARMVKVRVPATTANLGPGFDCLGLALGLWNEATITLEGQGVVVTAEGESAGTLPRDERNLVIKALRFFYEARSLLMPVGVRLHCVNRVPLGSGMGSSATAVLMGLLAGSALTDEPFDPDSLLRLAATMEGHADNAAAALWGGLTLVAACEERWLVRRVEVPALRVAIVLPAVDLPTRTARAALPVQVAMRDAAYNLAHTALVIEALREGDLELLCLAMSDRLHEPFRLALIPGAEAARNAARRMGAAVALSGAGPSLIAFSQDDPAPLAQAMQHSFEVHGVRARSFLLETTAEGASVLSASA